MAVIKYKDKEGNYHKVSIGGGSGTDEVYIGSDTPPSGAKLWIDPQGTPSGGGGGSASGDSKLYKLPSGVMEGNDTYTFSTEEAEKFRLAIADRDTTYMLDHYVEYNGKVLQRLSTHLNLYQDSEGVVLSCMTAIRAADKLFIVPFAFAIQMNGDDVISTIIELEE